MIPLEKSFQPQFLLRIAVPGDDMFLEDLYAETRCEELAVVDWNEDQKYAFLKMQFSLQKRAHEIQFPEAEHYILETNEIPVGSLTVERTAEIRLVDIALLPQFRGRGFGTLVLKQLQDEARAAEKPLTLHVFRTNDRAISFYERHGFCVAGSNETHLAMRWQG